MYIIDGFNYMYAKGYPNQDTFLDYMEEYAHTNRIICIIVFDGRSPEFEYQDTYLKIIYPGNADEKIIEFGQKYPDAYIVTSDNYIHAHVRHSNRRCIKSSEIDFIINNEEEVEDIGNDYEYFLNEFKKNK